MEQAKQSRAKHTLSDGVKNHTSSGGMLTKTPVINNEDHLSSNMVDSSILESCQKNREICSGPFPVKLLTIIKIFEEEGKDYIRWRDPHGIVFEINSKLDGFDENVMKRFFRGSKIASLYRQLNIYDFQRICKGTHVNCYFHKNFRKDNATLAYKIRRNAVKGDYGNGTGNGPPSITFEPGTMTDPLQDNSIQPRSFSTISSTDSSTASVATLAPQNPLLQQLRLETMLQLNPGLCPLGSSDLHTGFRNPAARYSRLNMQDTYLNGLSDMERMILSAVEARNIRAALHQEQDVLAGLYDANSSLDNQKHALISLLGTMNANNNNYNGILGANGEEQLMLSLGLQR